MRKQMRETKKKSNLKLEKSIEGVVTARQCRSCGHHEIGITTDGGRFVSLKPGMKVKIIRLERPRVVRQHSTS
jgi:hypothetical protein